MQIICKGGINEKTAVALGNFDGLHCAHTAIIDCARQYAKEHDILSCVLLFCDHTRSVIDNKKTKLLTIEKEKLDIIQSMGVDCVYICEFTEDFMHLSPQKFVDFLTDKLNCQAVCVGYDYRFGYKAEGDARLLENFGEQMGFDVLVTDEIKYNGTTVKSTKIRELVINGEIEFANKMLGRCFFVTGIVEKGLQNGRKIGTPTANVGYKDNKLIPQNGVYIGYTTVDEKRYKSVINVGNNPTFNAERITIESHILDFDGDIYGKTVKVEFTKRIRDDRKFNSLDQLKQQIGNDIKAARNYTEG